MTTQYYTSLEQAVTGGVGSLVTLKKCWENDLQQLDEDINQGIMEVLWGKIDM